MEHVVGVIAVISLVYAAFVALSAKRFIRGVPLLERLSPSQPKTWPRVSVIIPACNEEAVIGRALESRLGEGYPNAEYIVVNDRSTDRTGEIIDQMAKRDPRVVPVHVKDLTDGWLGKVHAMQAGVDRATGEWILFSDADIHHEAGTLARVVAHAEERGIDHVALFPRIWSKTFWLDVMMNCFFRHLATISRAWKVSDPSSKVSIGGGVFNLVRRTALDKIGGLETIRLEVVDDAALGQLLKWSGARSAVLNARGFVGLDFYRDLPDAIRGMEKNAFAMMRYDLLRAIVFISLFAIAELGSTVALAAGGSAWGGWARVIAVAALVVLVSAQLATGYWCRRPTLPTLLAPLGCVFLVVGLVRSTLLTLRHGGIQWRGTRYALADLRRGMRLVLA